MRGQGLILIRRILLLVLLVTTLSPQGLTSIAPHTAQAGSLGPQTPETPVQAPEGISLPSSQLPEPAATSLGDLPPLKAVVFVGPIDGENGEWTLSVINSAKETASALRSYGVTVQEFYPNQANGTWQNIKNAANGAHFIIYRGHGVYWSDMPYPVVGGFALKDTFVSSDMIRSELHPARNFIVMLYGCFTAGSAGNDTIIVSLDEARRRVEMYSDPFFDIGAGGYYADWFGGAFTSYVHSLFQGKTQRQAYEGFFDYNAGKMWRGYHQGHPSSALWLGWDNWYPPEPNWNNAFIGDPDKTIAQLFQQTSMVLSTKDVVYLAEAGFPKRSFRAQIRSSTTETFNWTATISSSQAWLTSVTPLQGTSGAYLTVEIDPSKDGDGGSTTIHVTTSNPNLVQPDQDITVTLKIVPEVYFTYLPAVVR